MTKFIFAVGLLLIALISPLARAQDTAVFYRVVSPTTTVVTALSPGSILSWSNAAVGVTGFIQRATTLDGVSNWTDFTAYKSTGTHMTVSTADYMIDYLVVDLSAGPSGSNYPVSYLTAVPSGGWSDTYKTTKLVFRRIPAGTFTMGSPTNELGRWDSEIQHQVTISQPFYIGVFEVTQQQWERVMGTWPSYFNNASYRNARPVEQVSYNDVRGATLGSGWPASSNVDAESFVGRLRFRTGKTFDLPTESQWEYAGRAGTTTALNSGYNLTSTSSDARMAEVGRYWYNGGSGGTQNGNTSVGTAKVGSYLPNSWGLYDIHGNITELCLDWYGAYPGSVTNPVGASFNGIRVNRGGCWACSANQCRVAGRNADNTNYTHYHLGFRVVALPSSP